MSVHSVGVTKPTKGLLNGIQGGNRSGEEGPEQADGRRSRRGESLEQGSGAEGQGRSCVGERGIGVYEPGEVNPLCSLNPN